MIHFKRHVIYALAVMLVLILPACAPAPNGALPETGDGQEPDTTGNLANTSWRLVSYGEPGSEIPVLAETEVTLEFEAGTHAGGSSGCNSFGAQYEGTDGELSFTEIISTLMACEEGGVMEQEQLYIQALQTAGGFELSGDQLTIHYGDGQGVLNFERIESS